jgi:hypothetical protein
MKPGVKWENVRYSMVTPQTLPERFRRVDHCGMSRSIRRRWHSYATAGRNLLPSALHSARSELSLIKQFFRHS